MQRGGKRAKERRVQGQTQEADKEDLNSRMVSAIFRIRKLRGVEKQVGLVVGAMYYNAVVQCRVIASRFVEVVVGL